MKSTNISIKKNEDFYGQEICFYGIILFCSEGRSAPMRRFSMAGWLLSSCRWVSQDSPVSDYGSVPESVARDKNRQKLGGYYEFINIKPCKGFKEE